MATAPTESPREINWIDIVAQIRYVEEHYGGTPEVHITTDEDDTRDALLCITCPRGCKSHPDAVGVAFTSCKVPYKKLHRLQQILFHQFYELIEQLDGACPRCLEAVHRLN